MRVVPTCAPVDRGSHYRPTIRAVMVRLSSSHMLQYTIVVSKMYTNIVLVYILQDVDECLVSNGGCQQICTNHQGGHECSCREGFTVDMTSCQDIDECITEPCQHFCDNLFGNFQCRCRNGYILDSNGASCNGNNATILYS